MSSSFLQSARESRAPQCTGLRACVEVPETNAVSNCSTNNRASRKSRARDNKYGSPGRTPGAQKGKHAKRMSNSKKEDRSRLILQCLNAILRTVNVALNGNYQLSQKTVEHWGRLVESVGGDWRKVCKYKVDAFLAFHYARGPDACIDPVPSPFDASVKDCPGRLLNGPVHKVLDSYVRGRKNPTALQKARRQETLQTLTTLKLICPRPTEEMLTENEVATFKSLTTRPPDDDKFEVNIPFPGGSWKPAREKLVWDDEFVWDEEKRDDELDACLISRDLVRRTIRSVQREVISRRRWRGGRMMNDVRFPPTRANYHFSVAKGGGVMGFCQDPFINLDGEKVPGGLLPSIEEKPVEVDMRSEVDKEIDELFKDWYPGEDEEPVVVEDSSGYIGHMMFKFDRDDTSRQDFVWAEILSRVRACDSVQVLKPIALAEPLKVRVITKGSWMVFMALSNLQQFLAKELKAHPAFVLTGTPVTLDIVKSLGPLRAGESFLNGDYTAATNNIRSWISRIYVEELSQHLNLSEQLGWLLMDGMVNNLIEGQDGIRQMQMSGQPMGFNNSFVGLCICNAALAKIVRAWDEGDVCLAPELSLCDARILVNGDDLLMPCSKEAYEVWKKIGAWVGLSPSIGKTYFTSEFAQINSRNFTYEDGEYFPVHSINMGLLEGAAKKGKHVNDMSLPCALSQLANNYRQLMADCDGDVKKKARIHGLFVELHKEKLEKAGVPWYVPCWAGGLGLTGYFIPSVKDRRAMHDVRWNIVKYQPRSIPVQEDANNGEPDKTWYVHQLAADRLPAPSKTFDKAHPGVKPYQQACGRMAVDMLFDSDIKVEDLFKGCSVDDRAWQNLRHNRKLWKNLLKRENLPTPLLPSECVERTVYDCFALNFHLPYSDDYFEVKDVRIDPEEGCPEGYMLREEKE